MFRWRLQPGDLADVFRSPRAIHLYSDSFFGYPERYGRFHSGSLRFHDGAFRGFSVHPLTDVSTRTARGYRYFRQPGPHDETHPDGQLAARTSTPAGLSIPQPLQIHHGKIRAVRMLKHQR